MGNGRHNSSSETREVNTIRSHVELCRSWNAPPGLSSEQKWPEEAPLKFESGTASEDKELHGNINKSTMKKHSEDQI